MLIYLSYIIFISNSLSYYPFIIIHLLYSYILCIIIYIFNINYLLKRSYSIIYILTYLDNYIYNSLLSILWIWWINTWYNSLSDMLGVNNNINLPSIYLLQLIIISLIIFFININYRIYERGEWVIYYIIFPWLLFIILEEIRLDILIISIIILCNLIVKYPKS